MPIIAIAVIRMIIMTVSTVIAILGHIVAVTASATVTPTLYNALLGGSFAAFRRFQKSLGFETFG